MSGSVQALEADFVVVGAGSAGCVMAARLSEDKATSVILLEAGGEDTNFWIHIPLGFGKTFADKRVNWMFHTEPDPGAANRSIYWPRGKVLGGSSSINGMVYIRGQHEDFDHWRQLGNPGWSASDVLPYFKRAEHQATRQGRLAWHRWAAGGVGCHLYASDLRRVRRVRRRTRIPAQRGLQWRIAGRRRLPANHDSQWQALLHRGRLSAAGDEAAVNLRVITRALTERVIF